MAISWPARIKPDRTPRAQFHHVNDIVPTVYDILGIKPPKVVDGFEQDPIDGVSMVYTFANAKVPGRKHIQYFDNNGSRGIYDGGWYACTFGPLVPWDTAGSSVNPKDWDSSKDVWELYNLNVDFSQAENLAAKEPKRLEAMKVAFLKQPSLSRLKEGIGIFSVNAHHDRGVFWRRDDAKKRRTFRASSTGISIVHPAHAIAHLGAGRKLPDRRSND
jgi:arylsulfatase A-like enzyme